jgi:hypothetical protein
MIGNKRKNGFASLLLTVPLSLGFMAPAVAAPLTDPCEETSIGTVCPTSTQVLNAEGTDYAGTIFLTSDWQEKIPSLEQSCIPVYEDGAPVDLECNYTLEVGGGEGATSVPTSADFKDEKATGAFKNLGFSTVPGFFYESVQKERVFLFQNPSDQPLTVSDVTGYVLQPDLNGASTNHAVVAEGTNVLTKPVTDFTVPAGEQVELTLTVSEPLVSMLRMNADGDLSGLGNVTRYDYTINGKTYWFEEYSGLGSLAPNDDLSGDYKKTDAVMIAEIFTPRDVAGSLPGYMEIGYSGHFTSLTRQMNTSYYAPESVPEPVVPPTVTPEPVVPPTVTPEPVVPPTVTPEPVVPPTATPEPKKDHPSTGIDMNAVSGGLALGSVMLLSGGLYIAAISIKTRKGPKSNK